MVLHFNFVYGHGITTLESYICLMQPQFNYFIKISNKSGYITILHATSKVKYLLKHHLLVEGFFPLQIVFGKVPKLFFWRFNFLGILEMLKEQ
jgi:hypothetical protein